MDSRRNRKSRPPASHSKDAAQLGFAHFGRRFKTIAGLRFSQNRVVALQHALRLRLLSGLRRR